MQRFEGQQNCSKGIFDRGTSNYFFGENAFEQILFLKFSIKIFIFQIFFR